MDEWVHMKSISRYKVNKQTGEVVHKQGWTTIENETKEKKKKVKKVESKKSGNITI